MELKINLIALDKRKNKVTMTIEEFKKLEKLASKQIEMKVKPIKVPMAYDDFEEEYSFVCPVCDRYIGRMIKDCFEIEDCFEIYETYCPECGQSIQRTYTEEEVKEIKKMFDNAI